MLTMIALLCWIKNLVDPVGESIDENCEFKKVRFILVRLGGDQRTAPSPFKIVERDTEQFMNEI